MSPQPSASLTSALTFSNVSALDTTTMTGYVEHVAQRNTNPQITITEDESTPNNNGPENNVHSIHAIPVSPRPSDPIEPRAISEKLSGTAIAVLMAPLCLSVFLSSLDLTIITPAIPAIVSGFNSVTGYVWIGSAFILASTASTPVWGTVADIWGRKPILLIALTIFLGGSLMCALAPRMNILIAGRAIQGLGSSGMGIMVNIIICDSFSLRDRGLYLATTSGVWAVGSVIGPIIGGSFTTRLNWRWCFWINLPIGAIVFIVLLFFLKLPSPNTPILVGLKAIDWIGSFLIIGAAMMILLGLDFGDVTFPWSSANVICLIVFGVVTIVVFVANEWKFAKNPIIPLRLFTDRSTVAAYIVWACNFFVLVGLSFYLPLYSQSVLGVNALMSGVHLIPLIVSCSLAAACVGVFIQKTGIYVPVTYIAHVLLALGTGLFINLKARESLAKLVIFEIITGIGIGMNIEPPVIAAQAAMTVLDTAVIQATMTFIRSLATTFAIVVGGVIFQNQMNAANQKLAEQLGEPLADRFNGAEASANVELIRTLPAIQQAVVTDAYFVSLRSVWIMFVVAAAFSLLSSFFMRAHDLSDTSKAVVLGVNRARQEEQQSDSLRITESIELHPPRGNTSRPE